MPDQTCERCGGTGYVIVEREGFSGAERCGCFLDQLAEHRIPRAGIPDRFAEATFENFNIVDLKVNPIQSRALAEVRRQVRSYARDYIPAWRKPGLLIVGAHGTGKTHLAVAAFREILRRGFDGVYYDYQTLLDRIQAGWNREAGTVEREAYQTAMDTPILLLDDLGARRGIEWVEDTVTAIITHRCNYNKTLIATTNLSIEQSWSGKTTPGGSPRYEKTLAEVIGMRVVSRLHEMCRIIQMPDVPDYRASIPNQA